MTYLIEVLVGVVVLPFLIVTAVWAFTLKRADNEAATAEHIAELERWHRTWDDVFAEDGDYDKANVAADTGKTIAQLAASSGQLLYAPPKPHDSRSSVTPISLRTSQLEAKIKQLEAEKAKAKPVWPLRYMFPTDHVVAETIGGGSFPLPSQHVEVFVTEQEVYELARQKAGVPRPWHEEADRISHLVRSGVMTQSEARLQWEDVQRRERRRSRGI